MSPQSIGLIMQAVPGLLQLFTSTIVPVAGQLLKFTLPRFAKIPIYLRLLWTIYQDKELNSEARKYLTSVLLILGSILTFMAYSYIPLTGVPIIGAFTTPVAGMIAIVISLVSLDCIFTLHREYLTKKFPDEYQLISLDMNELAKIFGKSWEDVVNQTQALLNSIKQDIDPNGNYDNTIFALINALISYLGDIQDNSSLPPDEINRRIVTEGLPPVAKIGGSLAEGVTVGTIAGAGAHGAATSVLVQAGFWTSVKTALGLGSGIVVGASTYTALTLAAPIGLAVIAGVGVYHGAISVRNEGEKRKLSAFLGDVLIAALPMAWVDGNFSTEERDTLEKLLLNSAINEQDAKRVREAIDQHKSFEEVLYAGLLKEENPEKRRMKYRLLLCTAWELAKSDNAISSDEINLHNRMAKFMGMEEEEVNEIRRLILLKSGIDIRDRISVVQGDITKESVDAIVNSANNNLLPGTKIGWLTLPGDSKKVDTAIHRAAGSLLQKECHSINKCAVGEVKFTKGYDLPAQSIIHTVVPTWLDGKSQERELLAQCYQNILKIAHENSLGTIVFPALATGTGKFPLEQAARIAVTEVQRFLNNYFNVEQVKFVCLDEQTYQVYSQAIADIVGLRSTEQLDPLITSSPSVALPA